MQAKRTAIQGGELEEVEIDVLSKERPLGIDPKEDLISAEKIRNTADGEQVHVKVKWSTDEQSVPNPVVFAAAIAVRHSDSRLV